MIIVTFLWMFVSISGPGSLNTWLQICWLSCWGMITRFPQMPYSTSHRALYMIPSAYARSALLCVCIDFLFFIWTKIQTLYGRIWILPLVMKMEMWWIKASFFFLLQFFRCEIELPTHNCPVVSHARAAYKHRYWKTALTHRSRQWLKWSRNSCCVPLSYNIWTVKHVLYLSCLMLTLQKVNLLLVLVIFFLI